MVSFSLDYTDLGTDPSATLRVSELTMELKQLGARQAVLLDSGGSCAIWAIFFLVLKGSRGHTGAHCLMPPIAGHAHPLRPCSTWAVRGGPKKTADLRGVDGRQQQVGSVQSWLRGALTAQVLPTLRSEPSGTSSASSHTRHAGPDHYRGPDRR